MFSRGDMGDRWAMIKLVPLRLKIGVLAVAEWFAPSNFRARRFWRHLDLYVSSYTRQAKARRRANERLLHQLYETYWFLRGEMDTEADAQAVLRDRFEWLVGMSLLSKPDADAAEEWVLSRDGPPLKKRGSWLRLWLSRWRPA
jgi:hypothetical protein